MCDARSRVSHAGADTRANALAACGCVLCRRRDVLRSQRGRVRRGTVAEHVSGRQHDLRRHRVSLLVFGRRVSDEPVRGVHVQQYV